MPARTSFRVTRGNSRLTVFRYRHPATGALRWRFGWRPDGAAAGWRWVTRRTRAQAEEAALAILERQARAELVWEQLEPAARAWLADVHRLARPADREPVLEFLRARQRSLGLEDAVARFLEQKRAAKGRQTRHLDQVRRDLCALSSAFPGRLVADLTADQLAGWAAARAGEAGAARRASIRRTLVMFWRWARRDGLVANDAVTAAERLPAVVVGPGALRVLEPAELTVLLNRVEWGFLPWLVLGAFAGLRPEELAPRDQSKPRLCWEHLDARFGVIRVPADVAKTRRPRVVPILPACRAWLEAFGWEDGWRGPVCLENAAQARETARLGAVLDQEFGRREGWPADCLRHSFGSYRNGELRALEQVAEEMGTSVAMLHRHYHNPKTAGEAAAWFGLRPCSTVSLLGKVIRVCSDENGPHIHPSEVGAPVERPKRRKLS